MTMTGFVFGVGFGLGVIGGLMLAFAIYVCAEVYDFFRSQS